MPEFTYDEELFSDLYKDVFGCGPSAGHVFYNSAPEAKQVLWDNFTFMAEEMIKASQIKEKENINDFEKQIEEMIALGAENRKQAIEWLKESVGLDEELGEDEEYFKFEYGLPSNYKLEDESY